MIWLLKLRDVGYEGMSRLMFKQHIICEHSSQMMVLEYFKIVIILKIKNGEHEMFNHDTTTL